MGSAHPHPPLEVLRTSRERFLLKLLLHRCRVHLPEGAPEARALHSPLPRLTQVTAFSEERSNYAEGSHLQFLLC